MRVAGFLAPLLFAASSVAQAVEEGIAPADGPPDGCEATVEGSFRIGTLENPTLRKRETAQATADGDLLCTLTDGILHDAFNRTGAVVANRQFQFDGPPQAGSIYTGGFSVCQNGSLAIGGSTRWWRCMSGTFGNLYDEHIGAQCHEIRIQAIFPQTSSPSIAAPTATVSLIGASPDVSETASATASGSPPGTVFPTGTVSSNASVAVPSQSANASITSGSASGSAVSTASSTASSLSFNATSTRRGSSPTTTATGTAVVAAPPAEGIASSLHLTGATLGAALAVIGAALIL